MRTAANNAGPQQAADIQGVQTSFNNAGPRQTADIQGVQSSPNNEGPQLAMENVEIQNGRQTRSKPNGRQDVANR